MPRTLPPLIDPSLLFNPGDSVPIFIPSECRELFDENFDNSMEDEAFSASVLDFERQAELQHAVNAWLDESNQPTFRQYHWEYLNDDALIYFGNRIPSRGRNAEMFGLDSKPKEIDPNAIKALVQASIGIPSKWISFKSNSTDMEVVNRSILNLLPFDDKLMSLRMISEFTRIGSMFKELEVFAENHLASGNYLSIPVFTLIREQIVKIQLSVLNSLFVKGQTNVHIYEALIKVKSYSEPISWLYTFFELDQLQSRDWSSSDLLFNLHSLAETPDLENPRKMIFSKLFMVSFRSFCFSLEKWLYTGEAKGSSSVVIMNKDSAASPGNEEFWDSAFSLNPSFSSHWLLRPHQAKLLEVGKMVAMLKRYYPKLYVFIEVSNAPSLVIPNCQHDMNNLKVAWRNFKELVLSLINEAYFVALPEKAANTQSAHEKFVLELEEEKRIFEETKTRRQEEYRMDLDAGVEEHKQELERIQKIELERSQKDAESERKRSLIVESLKEDMIQEHNRDLKELDKKSLELDALLTGSQIMKGPKSESSPYHAEILTSQSSIGPAESLPKILDETISFESNETLLPIEAAAIAGEIITPPEVEEAREPEEIEVNENSVKSEPDSAVEEDTDKNQIDLTSFLKVISTIQEDRDDEAQESIADFENFSYYFNSSISLCLTSMKEMVNHAFSISFSRESRWREYLHLFVDLNCLKSPFFSIPLLALVESSTTSDNIVLRMLHGAFDSYLEHLAVDDLKRELLKCVSFKLLKKSESVVKEKSELITMIDRLEVKWNLPCPLFLVFNKGIMSTLNRIFRLILKVKLLSYELSSLKTTRRLSMTASKSRQLFIILHFLRSLESYFESVFNSVSTLELDEKRWNEASNKLEEALFVPLWQTPPYASILDLLNSILDAISNFSFDEFEKGRGVMLTLIQKLVERGKAMFSPFLSYVQ